MNNMMNPSMSMTMPKSHHSNYGMSSFTGSSGMNMNGGMMDQLKNNLMTIFMVKNLNGSSAGSSSHNDMFYMIYVFVITQLIDMFMKGLPFIIHYFKTTIFASFEKPIRQKLTDVSISMTTNVDKDNKPRVKTASIVISVGVSDMNNVMGQALIDHITNNDNTKHIMFTNQNFMLNEKSVIEIEDDISVIMTETNESGGSKETQTSNGGETSSSQLVQTFEIFSFVKTTKELRNFLYKLQHNYQIATQNKLGNKRFFFNVQLVNAPRIINPNSRNNLSTSRGPDKFANRGTGYDEQGTLKDYSKLPPFFAFTMKQFQTNRKFSNLFGAEIDAIKKRVRFFVKNKKWYDEKGIPYTLGLLLSGSPGTGKTSCIKCLANETNRHIININLNGDITKKQLENLFFSEKLCVLNQFTHQQETYNIPLDQRIYVLEDIDCQDEIVRDRSLDASYTKINAMNTSPVDFNEPTASNELHGGGGLGFENMMGNVNTNATTNTNISPPPQNQDGRMDLSFLLNLLDGVLETPGRIIIMTSNYPERLDKALVRPGRIDIISKFTKCTNETMCQMLEFFYNTSLTAEQKKMVYNVPNCSITPAELSKIMFENFDDLEGSLNFMTTKN